MAELYAAGLGEEWQIALLGRRCDGDGSVQMLRSLPSWNSRFLNEFCPSSQVGHMPFDDKVIAAFRAIIDGDTAIPGMATLSLDSCLFPYFFERKETSKMMKTLTSTMTSLISLMSTTRKIPLGKLTIQGRRRM